MKTIFKISTVLFVGLTLVVSSCKKEEVLIDGCTDINAMNYQDLATSNDGSCVFAYDIAQGIWNIETDCQELTITILTQSIDVPLNDMFPETIEIAGMGDNVVAMDINGMTVLADVTSAGKVTIQDEQKISFDTSSFDPTGLIGEVDVNITGSGMIESSINGDLTLNLAFEVPLAGTQSSSCEISFAK